MPQRANTIMGLPARFWSKVLMPNTPEGCWDWAGASDRRGYGHFKQEGRRKLAHRVSYAVLSGPIADGLDLDHLCRRPSCVRPDHLEPVTRRENTMRGTAPLLLAARQLTKSRCPSGHPYDEANTYRYPDGRRSCRICRSTQRRAYNLQKAVCR